MNNIFNIAAVLACTGLFATTAACGGAPIDGSSSDENVASTSAAVKDKPIDPTNCYVSKANKQAYVQCDAATGVYILEEKFGSDGWAWLSATTVAGTPIYFTVDTKQGPYRVCAHVNGAANPEVGCTDKLDVVANPPSVTVTTVDAGTSSPSGAPLTLGGS